jgi:hypothetical protein
MRLIDATALVKAVLAERDKIPLNIAGLPHRHGDTMRGGIRKALRCIETAPTIDAEPVRHGRWEHGMQCSYCKQIDTAKPNYCCNCGTKMDEEVQHAEDNKE